MTQLNVGIIDMLKTIARMRLCEGTERGKWSAKQHLIAAKIISNCNYEIKTVDQAIQLPRVGDGIAEKIEEYLKTGTLEELNQNTELVRKSDTIGRFSCIPGVGFSTSQKWYEEGYRTRSDIEMAYKQGKIGLNKMQLIGLKYLDEISQKMTRTEMEGVAEYVRNCLKIIEPHFLLEIVGSYRRGISKSKDVDIVIYPDPKYYISSDVGNEVGTEIGIDGVMEDLLKIMKEQTIIFHAGDSNFMGLIEHNMILRRVDIWVVPISELITTLVGRTAYVETNKKLRWAASKKGYKLSNHTIYKRSTGQKIDVSSEDQIFQIFGIEKDYKPNYTISN